MATRISLTTGGTIVVPQDHDEVRSLLSLMGDARPVTFRPTWALNAAGELIEPEPVALRIEHVSMLADATPRREPPRRTFDPGTLRRVARKLRGERA